MARSYSVEIAEIIGDRFGCVDDADRARACAAAEKVLRSYHQVSAAEGEADYRQQSETFDGDESCMSGFAKVWIEARDAATVGLTSTWSVPGTVICTIRAA